MPNENTENTHENALETEAKIPTPDRETIRRRLIALGAADEGEQFERNWVLDDKNGSLEQRGILLRVRAHGESGEKGDAPARDAKAILTVKRRPENETGAFKTREEIETTADSARTLLRQLEIIGYEPVWMYEKRRRTLHWNGCVFALDECPEIGCFTEIEGDEHSIREACAATRLDPGSHVPDTYLGLWRKHLSARNEAPRPMTFKKAKTKDA